MTINPDYRMKRGDLLPLLRATLRNPDGGATDLTNAVSVMLKLKDKATGTLKVNAAAAFDTDRTNGVVIYTWITADTNTAGEYQGEFEVTWAAAKPQTFPTDSYFTLDINQDLG